MPRPDTTDAPDRPPQGPSGNRQRLAADALPAIAMGALLAFACWALAAHADPQVNDAGCTGVIAFVMVGAGAASYVLFALHAHAERRPSNGSALAKAARRLIVLLGTSFSACMCLLNTFTAV